MTPHELNLHIEEYGKRVENESETSLVTAYLTAYYHRVRRMPDLKKLINDNKPIKPKKPQTPEQMFAEIKKLNKKLNGSRDG